MSSWQRLKLAKGCRNQSTSEKYLALIVLPKPFPRNEFRGNASKLKWSQELIHTLLEKPVDQRKIFGTDRAAPQPSRPPEIDDRQITTNRMILRENAHTWPKYLKKNFTPHRFGDFSKRPQSPLLGAAGTGPERTQRRNWGLRGRLTENNFGRSLRNMAPTSEGRAEEVYREVFSSSFVSFRQ